MTKKLVKKKIPLELKKTVGEKESSPRKESPRTDKDSPRSPSDTNKKSSPRITNLLNLSGLIKKKKPAEIKVDEPFAGAEVKGDVKNSAEFEVIDINHAPNS